MPELKNIRHEKFCLLYVICGNASRAYREAGYPSKNPDVNASRLLVNAEIQNRITELKPKIELINDPKPRNREGLIEWLEDLMNRPADEPVKWSDKLRAAEIIARISGYNAADRVEVHAGDSLNNYIVALRARPIGGEIIELEDERIELENGPESP
jgi:phage terminase small subunit